MDIRCPNCGEKIDPHADHINNGRVFICEKGKQLARKSEYYCPNCDSTVVFIKTCKPEWIG